MENKKTLDQNPGETVSPEENVEAVEDKATKLKDGEPKKEELASVTEKQQPKTKKAAAKKKKPATKSKEVLKVKTEEKKTEVESPKVEVEEEKAMEEAPLVEEVKAKEEAPELKAEEVKAEEAKADETEAVEKEAVAEKEDVTPEKSDDEDEVDEEEADEIEEAFEEFTAEELVNRLEELVQAEDITSIKTKIALIKVAFMKMLKEEKQAALDKFLEEGGQKDDYKPQDNPFEKRFNKAFEVYRKSKIKYNELQENLKLENLGKKKEILEKLKELISSEETLKKTYDEFRSLQAEWKEVGMVPSGEVSNLWQSYHFLVEKFFDKVKINKELRDLDMKKSLELKIKLCEKTEELLLETSIIKSFKQLQKFHDEWKEIGPVPQEQSDELWERFKAATDKINERRREHYGKLQEEQEQNLLAKSGLCEQAEELISTTPDSMKGWQEQTAKMNDLFSVWRSIGRAPKKENGEVWDRFKGSMNTFFANKKEFLGSIKQEQMNNYNLKVDLCVEAENLKESTDWRTTTQDLIRLQQDWKKIGPVPRKHSDKIWKRFRAACDEFFQ